MTYSIDCNHRVNTVCSDCRQRHTVVPTIVTSWCVPQGEQTIACPNWPAHNRLTISQDGVCRRFEHCVFLL